MAKYNIRDQSYTTDSVYMYVHIQPRKTAVIRDQHETTHPAGSVLKYKQPDSPRYFINIL
jgi:hypothetical protein